LNVICLEGSERAIWILLLNVSGFTPVHFSPFYNSFSKIECTLPCDASFEIALRLLFIGRSIGRAPGRI
jgi:hypothetical protein